MEMICFEPAAKVRNDFWVFSLRAGLDVFCMWKEEGTEYLVTIMVDVGTSYCH